MNPFAFFCYESWAFPGCSVGAAQLPTAVGRRSDGGPVIFLPLVANRKWLGSLLRSTELPFSHFALLHFFFLPLNTNFHTSNRHSKMPVIELLRSWEALGAFVAKNIWAKRKEKRKTTKTTPLLISQEGRDSEIKYITQAAVTVRWKTSDTVNTQRHENNSQNAPLLGGIISPIKITSKG